MLGCVDVSRQPWMGYPPREKGSWDGRQHRGASGREVTAGEDGQKDGWMAGPRALCEWRCCVDRIGAEG